MKKLMLILSASLALMAISNQSAFAQTPVPCALNYTVATGDWLSTIAKKFFGDINAYSQIQAATNAHAASDNNYSMIADVNKLEPGWILCIPNDDHAPEGLQLNDLANATYDDPVAESGTLTLKNGVYNEQAAQDSTGQTIAKLIAPIAYGTLNGVQSAAVIIAANGGGSGTFYNLAVVQLQDDKPVNVASTPLGDRIRVNNVSIKDNLLGVDIITQGPGEGACCPTLPLSALYQLAGNKLTAINVVTGGKSDVTTIPALTGVTWKWKSSTDSSFTTTSPSDSSLYTIEFKSDGTVAIRADCNNVAGTYTTNQQAITISLGPSTLAACRAGSLDQEFLHSVSNAAAYSFYNNDLILDLKEGAGSMEFAK